MFRQLLYPVLPFRHFFFPIFVLCVIVLPAWSVLRWYRLRSSGQTLSSPREILLLITVLYIAVVAAVTLTPNRKSGLHAESAVGIELHPNLASLTCSSAILPAGSKARGFCVQNAAGNIALFVPLGILIPLVCSRIRFWKGIQLAIALSISIELLQYLSRGWGSYRSTDVNDVVLNSVGACLGLAVVSLLRWRPKIRPSIPVA